MTDDTKPNITIRRVRMVRITSWLVSCDTCEGVTACKNKKAATVIASEHAKAAHRGHAWVNVKS